MEIKELGHIVLYVRNLERSVGFYRDVLGWHEVVPDVPGMPAAAFSSGRTHHELLLIEVGENAHAIPQRRLVAAYTASAMRRRWKSASPYDHSSALPHFNQRWRSCSQVKPMPPCNCSDHWLAKRSASLAAALATEAASDASGRWLASA